MLMNARFTSVCPACQRRITKGAQIDYDRATRTARHAECAGQAAPGSDRFDMMIEDQMAERCGL